MVSESARQPRARRTTVAFFAGMILASLDSIGISFNVPPWWIRLPLLVAAVLITLHLLRRWDESDGE